MPKQDGNQAKPQIAKVCCRVSVRLSVCPVDRRLPLAAARARAADINRQLPAPRTGSIAAGSRAAAAGSIMLRAEVYERL